MRQLVVALALAGCHRVFALEELPPDAPGPPRCISDDYEDGALDPAWALANVANEDVEVVESAGTLEFRIPANTTGFNALGRVAAINLTEGSARIEIAAPVTLNTATELGLYRDTSNHYRFVITNAAGVTSLLFQRTLPTIVSNTSGAYDPAKHRYLRLRHEQASGKVVYETSMDGEGWATQHSEEALVPVDSLRVQLGVQSFPPGSTAPATDRLDNLLVETPGCVP